MKKEFQSGIDKEDLIAITGAIKKNKNIKEVLLFGSRAIGTYRNGSDIDLALKGENLKLNDILDASLSLDELFLPYKFDLLIYDQINESSLKEHIDQFGIAMDMENI